MTREELFNGYKEDVRDFAKECVHFEGELDATFFDNWAEHFTNLAERFRPSLPEGLEEAANKFAVFYDQGTCDGIAQDCFIAGAEYQRKQDQQLIELAEDHAMLAGMNKMKEEMMEKAVDGRYMKAYSKVYVESWPLDIESDSVKAGDEVRLIVLPKED